MNEEFLSRFEVHEWRHALAVLERDFPDEFDDITAVLGSITIYRSDVVSGGGGRSIIARTIDGGFEARGWRAKSWETQIVVDDEALRSPTHEVDSYKNRVAIELEWNNKDPFFDRDLNNFRLLFDLRAISVGVIITKSDELAPALHGLGVWKKYGTSTTWMHKLLPRLEGGGGGGCPILAFGIRRSVVDERRDRPNEQG